METIAVIDIGKTNAKLALVDLASLSEIAVLTTPNAVLQDGAWPHFDTDRLEAFILASLKTLNKKRSIDAISITTHGACAALLNDHGRLAAPVLDYEHTGPESLTSYLDLRPEFAETGSPRLPMGLNLGAQIYWQFATDRSLRARTTTILPWPQYWGYRLTGEMAADFTSLGCHTDLWAPFQRAPSSILEKAGWQDLLPRIASPYETLGLLKADIVAATGLRTNTPVKVGIHDSNASLLPHLLAFKDADHPAFSVTSTGTWVVNMAVGGMQTQLDQTRDTLVNVNAFGDPVPSSRFMGGREYELLREGIEAVPTKAEIGQIIAEKAMILPSIIQGSGPFPNSLARWTHRKESLPDGVRIGMISFYLAMMTDACLSIIGAEGPLIVEGPFAANAAYLKMLEAASGRPVVAMRGSATGTAIGAALLCAGKAEPPLLANRPKIARPQIDEGADLYAAMWRERSS